MGTHVPVSSPFRTHMGKKKKPKRTPGPKPFRPPNFLNSPPDAPNVSRPSRTGAVLNSIKWISTVLAILTSAAVLLDFLLNIRPRVSVVVRETLNDWMPIRGPFMLNNAGKLAAVNVQVDLTNIWISLPGGGMMKNVSASNIRNMPGERIEAGAEIAYPIERVLSAYGRYDRAGITFVVSHRILPFIPLRRFAAYRYETRTATDGRLRWIATDPNAPAIESP